MDIAGIREALYKQPFEPYEICLAHGRSLPVPHRDFVALHPRRIIVVNEDASWSVIDPLLIVSLDYRNQSKKGRNGAGRSRRPRKGNVHSIIRPRCEW
jgi:hypothetical protein